MARCQLFMCVSFMSSGIGLITYGTYGLSTDSRVYPLGEVAILAGIILGIITIFTCFRAIVIKRSWTFLIYLISLLLLIIFQLFLGILLCVANGDEEFVNERIEKYVIENFKKNETIDVIQLSYDCCGIYDPSSFNQTSLLNSCCSNLISCTTNSTDLRTTGCIEAVTEQMMIFSNAIAGIFLGFSIVEIIVVCLGLYFRPKQIQNDDCENYDGKDEKGQTQQRSRPLKENKYEICIHFGFCLMECTKAILE